MCLDAANPAAGCARCAPGFELATKPATSTTFKVPYCVGSALKSAAENELINAVGPAVNAISQAKANLVRGITQG